MITVKSEYVALPEYEWNERVNSDKAVGERYMSRYTDEADRGLFIFPAAYPEGKKAPKAAIIAKRDWRLHHKHEIVDTIRHLLARAAVIGTLDNVNLNEILKLVADYEN